MSDESQNSVIIEAENQNERGNLRNRRELRLPRKFADYEMGWINSTDNFAMIGEVED